MSNINDLLGNNMFTHPLALKIFGFVIFNSILTNEPYLMRYFSGYLSEFILFSIESHLNHYIFVRVCTSEILIKIMHLHNIFD